METCRRTKDTVERKYGWDMCYATTRCYKKVIEGRVKGRKKPGRPKQMLLDWLLLYYYYYTEFNVRYVSHKRHQLAPSLPLDNIRVVVIAWRLRGNIIRTALCCIV